MPQFFQNLHFPNSSDRKAFSFFVKTDFFQSNNIAIFLTFSFVNLAESTFTYLFYFIIFSGLHPIFNPLKQRIKYGLQQVKYGVQTCFFMVTQLEMLFLKSFSLSGVFGPGHKNTLQFLQGLQLNVSEMVKCQYFKALVRTEI